MGWVRRKILENEGGNKEQKATSRPDIRKLSRASVFLYFLKHRPAHGDFCRGHTNTERRLGCTFAKAVRASRCLSIFRVETGTRRRPMKTANTEVILG